MTAVDVVVPIYNAADDLRRCVEALLAHSEGDYRLLLIDDASTDAGVRRQRGVLRREPGSAGAERRRAGGAVRLLLGGDARARRRSRAAGA
jgi:hypothetical protein